MFSSFYTHGTAEEARHVIQNNAGRYGSTVEEDGKEKTYEWESRGSPLTLSIEVASVMGKQVFALSMIIIQVSYSKQYLMDCDDRVVGIGMALACEWTKTYVRLFPLMAVVVSLMAASRYLLHHRVFYELLRQGSLLNFDNFPAYKDPLFLVLTFCLVNAMMHFAIELGRQFFLHVHGLRDTLQHSKNADFQQELNKVILLYIAPSAVFLLFLFSSYDTESKLVPLSKYIEEDPDEMRRIVAKMPVLEENEAARVLQEGLPFQSSPEPCMATEAYKELILECVAQQDRVKASQQPSEDHLGSWRLVWTQWPSHILLDAHLSDERSVQFRYAWYIFSAISIAVIAFVFTTFVLQAFKDFNDVFIDGQRPDAAALLMELIFSTFTGWLAWNFGRNAFIPCTSSGSIK